MELCSTSEICEIAVKNDFVAGQFIIKDLEGVKGVLTAAQSENIPVILGITGKDFKSIGDLESFILYIKNYAKKLEIPVALHFDHGGEQSLEQIIRVVRLGFTGVMYDASNLLLVDNINVLRKVVEICHPLDISVEGAIGIMPSGYCGEMVTKESADNEKEKFDARPQFSDPQEAKTFIEATGIDILAISVGTIHGIPDRQITIDVNRLKEIKKVTNNTYLSIHGGSGTPKGELLKLIHSGVAKINIGADIYKGVTEGIRVLFENNPGVEMIRDLHTDRMIKNVVDSYIKIFNSFRKK